MTAPLVFTIIAVIPWPPSSSFPFNKSETAPHFIKHQSSYPLPCTVHRDRDSLDSAGKTATKGMQKGR